MARKHKDRGGYTEVTPRAGLTISKNPALYLTYLVQLHGFASTYCSSIQIEMYNIGFLSDY